MHPHPKRIKPLTCGYSSGYTARPSNMVKKRRRVKPDPRPGTEVWIARELGISRMSLNRYRAHQRGIGGRPVPSEISAKLALLDQQAEEIRSEREQRFLTGKEKTA